MVKKIVKDPLFLAQKSVDATEGPFQFAMINPVITNKSGEYQTEEGCLSLTGVRPCTRYQEIEVDKIYWRSVLCACVLILFLALSLILYFVYTI